MNSCLICQESTDNIINCTSQGCSYHAHEKCHQQWSKCLYCSDYCPTLMNYKRITKNTLISMMQEEHMNLINSYFYNSHDLSILVKETLATKITVISYPVNDNIYTYRTFDIDEVVAANFRDMLLKFHKELRTKYIFIDSKFTTKDHSDEIWNNGGSEWIGKYKMQIKW